MEKWVLKNKKADFLHITNTFGISEVTARCLVNKGYVEDESIRQYLYPDLTKMHDPMLLKDVQKACELLKEKIIHKEKIRIIGDYDVDGIVATYVLYSSLVIFGANVDYKIPHRMLDGYGINKAMVETAIEDGINMIITCDNGIAAIEQTKIAKDAGLTVIITDHHNLVEGEQGEKILPPADAIINPKQEECKYPFSGICGAMVAYKLMQAFSKEYPVEVQQRIEELFPYTAIATVCDVMDLVDENRIAVSYGLRALRESSHFGLTALMEETKIDRYKLSAFHLGFIIGPCLNASGRMDTALKGLELLLASDKETAAALAREVKKLNDTRKELTEEGTKSAIDMVLQSELSQDKVLVVYLKGCHESLAGIIAGRLREKFYKPAIVLTDAVEGLKGSARSIEDYDMFAELNKCRDLLSKFGGHKMAAGLSLPEENLEAFRRMLNENTTLTDEMLVPKVSIDVSLPLGYVNEKLVEELKLLEPFGKENQKPLFAEKNLKVLRMNVVGKNRSGIKMTLENQYNKKMEAMYFGDVDGFMSYYTEKYGEAELEKLRIGRLSDIKITATYFPTINEYNGNRTMQIIIQNYC